MNAARTEPGIESRLVDLDGVSLTELRELRGETIREATNHVVDRTLRLRARYRSGDPAAGTGERVD
ncbi:hypothetical protein [Amycolatopsis pigmentata]|uniref:FXSXX-COOH protein n=1 Tax=Amycolatopsis pigmentata TaxID=450801 RepID=A0ABW5FS50_9PSEU